MERWEMMKKGRMTEADRNHLKCLSPSSYRAASVDFESMFVCVWRIGVLPLSLWSIFLIPRGENEADVLLIRFAFTLFFFVSTFCLMLMSFSWMTLICVISMCLWSHYSFVSLWKYLAVYMHRFSLVKMNYNPTEYRNIKFWIGHILFLKEILWKYRTVWTNIFFSSLIFLFF